MAPWPKDAIMVVAALAGQEVREHMESVVAAVCRDCGAGLAADSFSVRRAEELGRRTGGRPVKFFCVACHLNHDRSTIQYVEDHRQ